MTGHLAKTCWSKKKLTKDESDDSRGKQACYKCCQTGHIAKFGKKTSSDTPVNRVIVMVSIAIALTVHKSQLQDV